MKAKFHLKRLFSGTIILFLILPAYSQLNSLPKEKFETTLTIKTTSVKNQFHSNTCWSFSVISFLESELIKEGKGEFDLSEMYIAHQCYIEKAEKYMRMHGTINFGSGGELNDALDIIRKYGIVPYAAYTGLVNDNINYDDTQMVTDLIDYLNEVIKNKTVSPSWKEEFLKKLDGYMGKVPDKFNYKGKEYTPQSFGNMLGINPDNYILFTSFIHHPYYQKFILEVPDNWSWGESINLPIEEFQKLIDNSLEKGFSLAISFDMTEKGFLRKDGIAIVTSENEKSDQKNSINDTTISKFEEMKISPQIRQIGFENYETTDDHAVHVVGIAKNQYGKKYYIMKNSWGLTCTPYLGFFYMSENYLLYKTTSAILNKNSIPPDILKKIGY